MPSLGWQCKIKNKAAIILQCKSDVKLIAALLFLPHSSLIWGYSLINSSAYRLNMHTILSPMKMLTIYSTDQTIV